MSSICKRISITFMFEKILFCPICKQSCYLNKIYTYQVVKNKRPNPISMKMCLRVKFICSNAKCGESYPLKKLHHHELIECLHRYILCCAQGCQYINNVETVIIHSINCPFHQLHCAICKSLYNVLVLTNDFNVIKFQCAIHSVFEYYHNILRLNNLHKDVFLRTIS